MFVILPVLLTLSSHFWPKDSICLSQSQHIITASMRLETFGRYMFSLTGKNQGITLKKITHLNVMMCTVRPLLIPQCRHAVWIDTLVRQQYAESLCAVGYWLLIVILMNALSCHICDLLIAIWCSPHWKRPKYDLSDHVLWQVLNINTNNLYEIVG